MATFIILSIIFGGFGLAVLEGFQKKKEKESRDDRIKKEKKYQIDALNNVDGFNPAVAYAGGPSRLGVAIDPHTSKFAIIGSTVNPSIFNFNQLISVEIQRNGNSLTRTDRRSQIAGAALGTVLLGPAGLLLGGLTGSKRSIDRITLLSLKIYTTDLIDPVHEIIFFKDKEGLAPDDFTIQLAATKLDEWYSRFRSILDAKSHEPSLIA
jgi:hypothetical protein